MVAKSRYISVRIARPADEVYRFVTDTTKLPLWAHGLNATVWTAGEAALGQASDAPVEVCFAENNDFGVCDLQVTLPSGEVVTSPMRVVSDGEGSEVLFTLRPREGMGVDEIDDEQAAIAADLDRLREIIEAH
jgi:uncharacterized protein YndB with AHSA1/START domain